MAASLLPTNHLGIIHLLHKCPKKKRAPHTPSLQRVLLFISMVSHMHKDIFEQAT